MKIPGRLSNLIGESSEVSVKLGSNPRRACMKLERSSVGAHDEQLW